MWGNLDDREREARKALLTLMLEGKAPNVDLLAVALGLPHSEVGQLLEALVAKGFVVRDTSQGAVAAAYPLSVRPTRHRVTLGSGQRVHALCAVDALGVSPLFGVSVTIEACCPHCDQTIRLHVQEGEIANREPADAVLWYSMADLLEKRIEGLDLSAEH